ncbi:MAG: hypothetical protein E7561_01645 [Ruminococcaceae bacterium]|nr:hypothetical protein [Oscillospiraceae bacterium]
MIKENKYKQIYIVISQTGTILSRILKLVTGAEYNHVSLALSSDLESLYSFGRKHAYNPFFGGFVTESPNYGTFKRFYNTKVLVLAINVDSDRYSLMSKEIKNMLCEKSKYRYNYLGVCLAAFKICMSFNNRYYCSEFVKYFLQNFDIDGACDLPKIPQPIHFLNIPYADLVYTGKLKDYKNFYLENLQSSNISYK